LLPFLLLLTRRRRLLLLTRWWCLLTLRLRRTLLLMLLLLPLLEALLLLVVLLSHVLKLPLLLFLHLLPALLVSPLLIRALTFLRLLLFRTLALLVLLPVQIVELLTMLLLELRIAVRRRIHGSSRRRPVVARRPVVGLHVWSRRRCIWPIVIRWTIGLCIRRRSVWPIVGWPVGLPVRNRRRCVWPIVIRWTIGLRIRRRSIRLLSRRPRRWRTIGVRVIRPVVRRSHIWRLGVLRMVGLRVVRPLSICRRCARTIVWLNVALLLLHRPVHVLIYVLRWRISGVPLLRRCRSGRRSHPDDSRRSRLLSLSAPNL
jgi:hypothetical protein